MNNRQDHITLYRKKIDFFSYATNINYTFFDKYLCTLTIIFLELWVLVIVLIREH